MLGFDVGAFYAFAAPYLLDFFYGRGLSGRRRGAGGRYTYLVQFVGGSTYVGVYRLRRARRLLGTSGSCPWGSSTAAPRSEGLGGGPAVGRVRSCRRHAEAACTVGANSA